MEFMYLVFTRIPGERYRRRLTRVFVVLALRNGKGKCVIRDGEKEGRGYGGGGKREIIYLSLHCHHLH